MTDEEYLRACGWECEDRDDFDNMWTHPRHPRLTPGRLTTGHMLDFTLAEAVEAQLAEDRARLAFFLERSCVMLRDRHSLMTGEGDEVVQVLVKPMEKR